MEDWNWAVIVAAVFGVIGTIGAQVTLARGEPGKLKTLRLFNQVITEYAAEDEGRPELVRARAAFAHKVSRSYLVPSLWDQVGGSRVTRALGSFLLGYAVFITTALLLVGPDRLPELWVEMRPIGQLVLVLLAVFSFVFVLFSTLWMLAETFSSPAAKREMRRFKIRRRARHVARLRKQEGLTAAVPSE